MDRQLQTSRSAPAAIRPMMAPAAANPDQMATPRAPVDREGRCDGRQCPGHDHRGAEAHDHAGGDQARRAVGECGRDRPSGENRCAGDEDGSPPDAVSECAQRQHECGEGDGVAVGDPGEGAVGRAECHGQVGKREVDRRHGGDDEHEGQAHRGEDAALCARCARVCKFGLVGHGVLQSVRAGLSQVVAIRRVTARMAVRVTAPRTRSGRAGAASGVGVPSRGKRARAFSRSIRRVRSASSAV